MQLNSPERVLLDTIPFEPDVQKIQQDIKLHEAYPELEPQFESLVEQARAVARPRALYLRAVVEEVAKAEVLISGYTFRSSILSRLFRRGDMVFPYVATCGVELEAIDVSAYDMLASWWKGCIETEALNSAMQALEQELRRSYGQADLSSVNPGSGNVDVWPVEQQATLFSLMGDTSRTIGVELTPSYLMRPAKSLSGIMFASAHSYCNCNSCTRQNCPDRRAPFTHSL